MIGSTKAQRIAELRKITGIYEDSGIIEITPEMAVTLLGYNKKNRAVSAATVKKYAKQMKEGQWHLDSNAISIGEDGYLSNGQHRLMAVTTSGVSIRVFIVFGVDNHSEMDRGKQRTIADNVGLSKVTKAAGLANHKDLHTVAAVTSRIIRGSKSTVHDVENLIEKYGSILLDAKKNGLIKSSGDYSRAAISAAIFVAHANGVDVEILKRLRRILSNGLVETDKDKSIIKLRDALGKIKGGGYAIEIEVYNRVLNTVDTLEKGQIKPKNSPDKPKYTITY